MLSSLWFRNQEKIGY
uniref:Uncharacterized protein n=1 Tax=Arundo donax TaxID=35708 RepID=A0A0A8ZM99_ARUDO